MTGPISPDQLQHLLAGYVLYDLSPEEAALLAALLAANPDLQRQIDRLQRTLEVAYDGDPISPPPALREAVLRAAGEPPVVAPDPVPVPVPSLVDRTGAATGAGPRLWRWLPAAAAVLIAGLSLSNLLLWRTLQLERARRPAGEPITIVLGSPYDSTPGQAQVVIDPETLVGSLTVENLPPLEPGSVYVLWTVVDPNAPETLDDKNAILTTVFTVDGQGRVSQPIDLPPVYRRDPGRVRAIAITQESAAAPQAHRSAPILIQPL